MSRNIFMEHASLNVIIVLLPLNLETRPDLQLSLGAGHAHYSPRRSQIGFFLGFFFDLWFTRVNVKVTKLYSVHINLFTEMKSTAKLIVLAFDLTAGSSLLKLGPSWEGLHFPVQQKEGKSLIYMFTEHTAFLRIKLFCKEKLFIERSHLLIYSVRCSH